MQKGDWIRTPRFLTVKIEEVFENRGEAVKAGYTEPTYYKSANYEVVGKQLDEYHMTFTAYKK